MRSKMSDGVMCFDERKRAPWSKRFERRKGEEGDDDQQHLIRE